MWEPEAYPYTWMEGEGLFSFPLQIVIVTVTVPTLWDWGTELIIHKQFESKQPTSHAPQVQKLREKGRDMQLEAKNPNWNMSHTTHSSDEGAQYGLSSLPIPLASVIPRKTEFSTASGRGEEEREGIVFLSFYFLSWLISKGKWASSGRQWMRLQRSFISPL